MQHRAAGALFEANKRQRVYCLDEEKNAETQAESVRSFPQQKLGCVTTDGVSNPSQSTPATPAEAFPQQQLECATTGRASAVPPPLHPSRSCLFESSNASKGNSVSTPEATLRQKSQAPDDPTTAAEAIECIRLAAVSKLRIAMKILRTTQLTPKQTVDVIGNLAPLITQEQKMTSTNCPKLINYLRMFAESTPDSIVISNVLAQTSMRIALTRNMLVNPDRARAVKALLVCCNKAWRNSSHQSLVHSD
jgi:hypothetical protein